MSGLVRSCTIRGALCFSLIAGGLEWPVDGRVQVPIGYLLTIGELVDYARLRCRYIVTSLTGEPRHLYEVLYCARGQAENLIKLHKGQLASDRTSCQSPLANQVRLVLHTGAYWLMLALRDAIPRAAPLARAEFATLRLRLLKIGARVVEKVTRIRIHFTSACPNAALFRQLAGRLAAAGP